MTVDFWDHSRRLFATSLRGIFALVVSLNQLKRDEGVANLVFFK